jgi:hypothetical protein
MNSFRLSHPQLGRLKQRLLMVMLEEILRLSTHLRRPRVTNVKEGNDDEGIRRRNAARARAIDGRKRVVNIANTAVAERGTNRHHRLKMSHRVMTIAITRVDAIIRNTNTEINNGKEVERTGRGKDDTNLSKMKGTISLHRCTRCIFILRRKDTYL